MTIYISPQESQQNLVNFVLKSVIKLIQSHLKLRHLTTDMSSLKEKLCGSMSQQGTASKSYSNELVKYKFLV